jgi:DNA-directed RNA polymerase specialized sigma24 family protein
VGQPDPTLEEVIGRQRADIRKFAAAFRVWRKDLQRAAAQAADLPCGGRMLLFNWAQMRLVWYRGLYQYYGWDPLRPTAGIPDSPAAHDRWAVDALAYTILDSVVNAGILAAVRTLAGPPSDFPTLDRRIVEAMATALQDWPATVSTWMALNSDDDAAVWESTLREAGRLYTGLRIRRESRLEAALGADGQVPQLALLDYLPGLTFAALKEAWPQLATPWQIEAQLDTDELPGHHAARLARDRARNRGPRQAEAATEPPVPEGSPDGQAWPRGLANPAPGADARESDQLADQRADQLIEEMALFEEARRLVSLERLSPLDGAAFVLDVQQLPNTEIAEHLSMTANAAGVHLHRAKDKLRRRHSREELRRRFVE